ncbi:hypothetical protein ACQKNB_08330 [Lysinibacillus xylanilyticus]|uniref:hypothetical protein n=1 Tax=Lysinibacillus xylanilyticus TaxID=582475 RepID=UPI003CFBE373
MCKKVSMNHGGFGCDECSNRNVCHAFGPFLAADAACITPEPCHRGCPGAMLFSSGGITFNGTDGSLIGLGLGNTHLPITNGQITLPATVPAAGDPIFAYTIPSNGCIKSLAAHFVVTAGAAQTNAVVTIQARIYRATGVNATFDATNAFVNLTPITASNLTLGHTVTGTADILPPVQVGIGDRLLVVFTATVTGGTVTTPITGIGTAGVSIE